MSRADKLVNETSPEDMEKALDKRAHELSTHLFEAAKCLETLKAIDKDLEGIKPTQGISNSSFREHNLNELASNIEKCRKIMHQARWYKGV